MPKKKTVSKLDEPYYLSIKDVATELRVHPFSVQRWIWAGELAGLKAGRRWQISPIEVKNFLVKRTAASLEKGKMYGVKK